MTPPPNIRVAHPRVLLTSDDLPRLRERARTTHAAEFQSLLALAAAPPVPDASDDGTTPLWRLAFLHLLSGDPAHVRTAVPFLRHVLGLDVSGGYFVGARRLKALAAAYDWMNGALPDELRTEVGARALAYCQALYDSHEVEPGVYFLGHAINQMPYILMAACAVGDELPGGAARHFLADTLDRLDRQLPCYRHFLERDCFQQSYSYTGTYVAEFPYLFSGIEAALGKPMYEPHRWWSGVVNWWTYAFRDDDTFVRFGDYFCAIPVFENPQYLRPLAAIASRYGNGLAQHWVNRFRTRDNEPDAFLFEDRPGVPRVDPNTLPRTKYFAPMGVAVARGDFAAGARPVGTVATFKCTPLYLHNHGHRDANSFTLYHRGDLAIDSGAYDAYESPHWYNYYIRTIAHNTVVVHDPHEQFVSRGREYANDGGQRFVNEPHFQPRDYDDIFNPAFEDGRVLAYTEGDRFAYVCGDASRCYREEKVHRFLRHAVFLLDHPAKGHVSLLVLDDIELHRQDLEPRFLLHTMEEPVIEGARVVATHRSGRLTATVLLPEAPRVKKVGGPGHEFDVGGRNYPLNREMIGPHTPGSWRAEVTGGAGATRTFLALLTPTDLEAAPPQPPALARFPGGFTVTQGDVAVILARGQSDPLPLPPAARVIRIRLAER